MADPQNRERFELRRESDALYSFVQKARPDGTVGYQRQDHGQGRPRGAPRRKATG